MKYEVHSVTSEHLSDEIAFLTIKIKGTPKKMYKLFKNISFKYQIDVKLIKTPTRKR